MKQQDNRQGTRKSSNTQEAKSASGSSNKGDMSVREAGHKGGQRERELVSQGHQAEKRGK